MRGEPQALPSPLLEVDRSTSVDEASVEPERREGRIRKIDLVRRIGPAQRGRPRAERRPVGVDVEQVVRADRELDAASMESNLKVADPLRAQEDIIRAERR